MTRSDLSLIDELRIIAQNGLEYVEDPYDRERYERLLDLITDTSSQCVDTVWTR
ncbi:NUDIX hydrolase N-terminal domain-containing protein [Halalkalicoccus salilacus]|uniref:NUDIX hydrolase N-terminal domain-containing protein n=1 Tax=Halalkalicoccus salilacus TaxID=3117459 RepID=UPI00300EE69E